MTHDGTLHLHSLVCILTSEKRYREAFLASDKQCNNSTASVPMYCSVRSLCIDYGHRQQWLPPFVVNTYTVIVSFTNEEKKAQRNYSLVR